VAGASAQATTGKAAGLTIFQNEELGSGRAARRGQCPVAREPRPGMNFAGGAPRRGSDSPQGILGLGGGITPEGACTLRSSSTRGKQTALNSSVTMTDPRCLPRALHRRAGAARPSARARVGAAGPSCVSPTSQLKREYSVARLRLDSRKSVRPFKGIICADVSEIAVDTMIAVNGFFD
jgi:hypothetical protein